jgi:hypothetical protein
MLKCFEADWSWISFIMFNFNWSNSDTRNFFLKNKVFSIISNFFNSISSNDFFRFRIAFRIIVQITFFWFADLILSNRNNFEFRFFSYHLTSKQFANRLFLLIKLSDAYVYFNRLLRLLIDLRIVSLMSLLCHSSFLIDKLSWNRIQLKIQLI